MTIDVEPEMPNPEQPETRPSEFAQGLQLGRLHPPHIITFLQGLPRRIDERLVEQVGDEPGTGTAIEPDDALDAIADRLSRAIDAVKAVGYALDESVRAFWSPAVATDPEVSRIGAAALELARWVAGVPDREWTANPDLLERLRSDVATVAERLDDLAPQGADTGEWMDESEPVAQERTEAAQH